MRRPFGQSWRLNSLHVSLQKKSRCWQLRWKLSRPPVSFCNNTGDTTKRNQEKFNRFSPTFEFFCDQHNFWELAIKPTPTIVRRFLVIFLCVECVVSQHTQVVTNSFSDNSDFFQREKRPPRKKKGLPFVMLQKRNVARNWRSTKSVRILYMCRPPSALSPSVNRLFFRLVFLALFSYLLSLIRPCSRSKCRPALMDQKRVATISIKKAKSRKLEN